MIGVLCTSRNVFEFDNEDDDLGLADVFHGVRRQGIQPLHDRNLGRSASLSAVQEDTTVLVAANEIAPTQ